MGERMPMMREKKSRNPKEHPALADLRNNPIHPTAVRKYSEAKLSYELIDQVTQYILVGGHPEVAASAVGVCAQTWKEWLIRGNRAIDLRSEDPMELTYATLVLRVREACARSELRDVQRLEDAARLDWKAAAYRLQNGHGRERWNAGEKVRRHIHQGDPSQPIEHLHGHVAGYVPIDVSTLDVATCERLLASLNGQGNTIDAIPMLPPPAQPLSHAPEAPTSVPESTHGETPADGT
jgi:hypothetical protein